MATISPMDPLKSAQEHIPTCEKHNLIIDLICEDCDEFICSQCAKRDHKDHDWKTIPTAGSLKRRELKKTMCKVEEEDLKKIEEKIRNAEKLMEDNQKCYDSELSKLQKHFDAIVLKLNDIKNNFEETMRGNLDKKNAEVSEKKSDLQKKREHIKDLVKFLKEKHGTMSNYSLIDNLRDLTNLVSNTESGIEKGDHSVRYRRGDISERLLKSMMGQTLDLDEITVTEENSFQYGDDIIGVMLAFTKDTCLLMGAESEYLEKINIKNKKREKITLKVNDLCLADNGDVYATDEDNKSIVCLSPSGSVSTVFSTAPLEPGGICQSTEGGLILTLVDTKSDDFQPDSHSRRLVRHVTLTGDVIRAYEFQEDGQTRLFTVPIRVKQNGNTDICVVNMTSESTSELVILSSSGSLKYVYRGQNKENWFLIDVVCDSECNIIVSEAYYSQVHLLSPSGEFMKYLLTENEVTNPFSVSLYKSTLWVGDAHGLLLVFHYKI